ncbi:unnamed protein product, partial [Soboliphyme baturini]|uniref:ribose-5-phosphate isomerase n=1 Tax=Soboliphyme baturini TaxID=241478 RepID=A0A183ITS8_9BILA
MDRIINPTEDAKKLSALTCVDNHVKSDQAVGIGSGSTIVYAVQHLAAKIREGKLKNVAFVPSSFQARQLIIENGLTLSSLESFPILDVAIDG